MFDFFRPRSLQRVDAPKEMGGMHMGCRLQFWVVASPNISGTVPKMEESKNLYKLYEPRKKPGLTFHEILVG